MAKEDDKKNIGGGGEYRYVRSTNVEVHSIYRVSAMDMIIRARILQCLGRIERIEGQRTVKTVAMWRSVFRNKRGRPQQKWRDAIITDLKDKDIMEWTIKAKNRNNWTKIIKLWT